MNRRSFLAAGLAGGAALVSSRLPAVAARVAAFAGGAPVTAAAFTRRRRYLSTRFGDIAYVDRGAGPVALFLHGFPLNSFQWRDAIERLAPLRRCLAPDFLGLGNTIVADGADLRPDNQVRMLLEFLDKLGVDQVDVIANDSGGAVAQLLLVRHPGRLRSVLLSNCDTEVECPPKAMEPVLDLAGQGRYAQEWLVPWWKDPQLARTPDGFGGMCYADAAAPTDDAVAAYFTPLVESAQRIARTNRFALALARNSLAGIAADLGRSRVPVGIVWGMADAIFSRAGLEYLVQSLGNLKQVRRLPADKLFWPEERPEVIAVEAMRLWGAA